MIKVYRKSYSWGNDWRCQCENKCDILLLHSPALQRKVLSNVASFTFRENAVIFLLLGIYKWEPNIVVVHVRGSDRDCWMYWLYFLFWTAMYDTNIHSKCFHWIATVINQSLSHLGGHSVGQCDHLSVLYLLVVSFRKRIFMSVLLF